MKQAQVLQFPFRAAAENLAIVMRIDEEYREAAKEMETTELLHHAMIMKHSDNENTRRRAEFYFAELRQRGVTIMGSDQ